MDVLQSIISFFYGLEDLLDITASDPLYYSITFFVYAILATAFLPLPIELGLLLSPETSFVVLALVLGLGRAVGGVIVFYAGRKIGSQTHAWFYKWEWSRQVIDWFERTVLKLGYPGLYVVMSIPFMLDSIPLYAFSLSDNEMDLKIEWFALTNFLAGFTRAILFLVLLDLFGIGTFHSLL
jgi:membrane protein DedA with SNARE-associated domain